MTGDAVPGQLGRDDVVVGLGARGDDHIGARAGGTSRDEHHGWDPASVNMALPGNREELSRDWITTRVRDNGRTSGERGLSG